MMHSYTVKRTSFCLEPDSGPDLGSAYPGLDFFAHLVGLARECHKGPMKPSWVPYMKPLTEHLLEGPNQPICCHGDLDTFYPQ